MASTSSLDQSASAENQSQPRKRRRRAPAAGAADDCFTCSNLGIICDRRRPYCSQCLNEGKDCTGYKTTLTWGVGVASRGKLRGLSLPVVGTAKVPHTSKSTKKKNSTPFEGGNISNPTQSHRTAAVKSDASAPNIPRPSPGRGRRPSGHESIGSTSALAPGPASWQDQAQSHMSRPLDIPSVQQKHPMQPPPLHTTQMPVSNSYEGPTGPASASSLGGFSNFSFPSPALYSATSDNSNYLNMASSTNTSPMSLANIVPNFGQPIDQIWAQSQMESVMGNTVSEFGGLSHEDDSYTQSSPTIFQEPSAMKSERKEETEIDEVVYGNIAFDNGGQPKYEPTFLDDAFSEDSMMISPFSNIAIGKTPRMQYLINYYAEVISPVIVAFDGPNNPYRTHILRLAMESETLQHAIAALSASNLRQRRDNNVLVSTGKTLPARRSSMAHSALTNKSWQSGVAMINPEDQAREELLHKSISIHTLNSALADPVRRKDDSILATLLILCLFHICDSGVAKFQTQFAGVKKLLSLRSAELAASNTNASSSLSKETSWYTRMFTWFDAFTATVNNREGQLQGNYLDISSLSDEEWALENLAGCDGRLFKIIAKLGRLNVLSRNGSVDPDSSLSQPQVPHPHPFAHLDGNGWTEMVPPSPTPLFAMPAPLHVSPTFGDSPISDLEGVSPPLEDNRPQQFWDEWTSIRTALLQWHLSASSPIFSPSTPTSTLPLSLTLDQKADLLNISESFRYSALLYLERLARPFLPSSDPQIQSWVSRALNYIKLVKSDVYLLWPLFITGSECVKDEDRQCIRQRCLDIQKDSGFMNNWSTLELLEKVWARSPSREVAGTDSDSTVRIGTKRKAASPPSPTGPSSKKPMDTQEEGFRWKMVMDSEKNEGEYIVV